jgi:hypothetical protein
MSRLKARLLAALLLTQAALAADTSTSRVLNGLVEAAVRAGRDAALPPHLSVLLGLTITEASTPVRQLGFRNGDDIKTFNVSAVEHHDVVLMSVGANKHAAAYLMSPDGVLRKAIVYEVGGATRELRLAEANPDFLQQRRLWLDRAAALGVH